MGWYVYTLISFPVNQDSRPDEFMAVAKKHLDLLSEPGDGGLDKAECAVSLHFLAAVAAGKCVNCSTKGEALAYAATRNGGDIELLVNDLLPYFDELWEKEFICDWEHIILIENHEQSHVTFLREVTHRGHRNDECRASQSTDRIIKYDAQPWSWHQM